MKAILKTGVSLALMICMIVAAVSCDKCAKDRDAKQEASITAAPEEKTETCFPLPTEVVTEKPNENEAVKGEWLSELDIARIYIEVLAQDDPDILETNNVEKTPVKLYFKFDGNGSYSYEADETSYKSALESLSKTLVPYFKKSVVESLGAYAASLSEEMLLDFLGLTSWDDFAQKLLAELNTIELKGDGKYTAEDGKLTLSDMYSNKSEFIYRIENGEMRIEPTGEEQDMLPKDLFPLKLKKIN